MESVQVENFDFIATESLVSEDTQELFVIGMSEEFETTEKFLKIYSYGQDSFKSESHVSFNESSLSQDVNIDILMARIDNSTLFSDGNFLYRLETSNRSTTAK